MNLRDSHIHFIGIGGIGMSGIAEVLSNMGCSVTGSDAAVNNQVERLKAIGVSIAKGHTAQNIPNNCDVVVYSSAVLATNPEVVEAKRRKIPVIQRAEMLSELMRLKRGIAIAGSHGKTTTTSMTAAILLSAGLDPTIVVGGRLDLIKSTAALGKGEWLLAEADESDGSFMKLSPEIIVITNIDNDHMDHYKTIGNLEQTFLDFANRVPFYGRAVLCIDDPRVEGISKRYERRVLTYGFSDSADLQIESIKPNGTGQIVKIKNKGSVTLTVPGRHNALNAVAAIGVALELGLPFDTIAKGIEQYRGVDRRLQKKGIVNDILVIDDYGHHPTEVAATLEAIKSAYPQRRAVVVFQPHRFTRTRDCWSQFLTCFKDAGVVCLLDIYPAGEQPIEGITSQKLATELGRHHRKVVYLGERAYALGELKNIIKPSDLLLTLGAGDVWKIGDELLK